MFTKGETIRFTTPQCEMVAEVLDVDDDVEKLELRVIQPWFGVRLRVDFSFVEQPRKRLRPAPLLKQASLRIFRPRHDKEPALALFDGSGDLFDGIPIEVTVSESEHTYYPGLTQKDPMLKLYQDTQSYSMRSRTMEEMRSQGFNPAEYEITQLMCGMEHVHLLKEWGVNLERVTLLHLTVEGDEFTKQRNNVHLNFDYFHWDRLLEMTMCEVTTVNFHVTGNFIIPKLVWSLIYDGRFRMAREICFVAGSLCTQSIRAVLTDPKASEKVATICPYLPIGEDAELREKDWYVPMVRTFLYLESCEDAKQLPPVVYKLFAKPENKIFDSTEDDREFPCWMLEEWCPEEVRGMLPPVYQIVHKDFLLPLKKREVFERPMTFEDAVLTLSLASFCGYEDSFLHYLIHTWVKRLPPTRLNEGEMHQPELYKHFLNEL